MIKLKPLDSAFVMIYTFRREGHACASATFKSNNILFTKIDNRRRPWGRLLPLDVRIWTQSSLSNEDWKLFILRRPQKIFSSRALRWLLWVHFRLLTKLFRRHWFVTERADFYISLPPNRHTPFVLDDSAEFVSNEKHF